jgi:DivIVA domain-containing protein
MSGSPASAGGDIRNRRFGTVRRGFDTRQVTEYLDRVADEVDALQRRIAELESDPDRIATSQTSDRYESISAHVAVVMRAFDHDVERLRAEAEADAERTIADARAEAERIRRDAEIKSEEVRAAASSSLEDFRKDAEAELAQLEERRRSVRSELGAIRELLASIDDDDAQVVENATSSTPAPPAR